MNRYRVAQVGAGGRGKICDLDQQKLKDYAEDKNLADGVLYDDAGKMLAATTPDVFCFVTQPDVRLSMVELATEHGVTGLAFEKPMATSLREAWDSTRLCREHNIKAVVSHQQKYLTSLQKVKQLVDAGEVGDVIEINATCQGWLSQLGTHFMDYILWVNNGIKAKWAVGHVHGRELLSDHHPSPNYTMGHVEFENGVRSFFEFGKLSASYMPKEKFWLDSRLIVHGTHGYVWGDTDGRWSACTKSSGGEVIGGQGDGWAIQEPTRLQPLFLKDFADWLDDDSRVHPCNIDIAYHGYEILESLCISAMDNVRVDLPLDPSQCEDILERMRRELPECPERE